MGLLFVSKILEWLGWALVIWAFADFALSFASIDLWRVVFDIELPQEIWRYSSTIEGVMGGLLIKVSSEVPGIANLNERLIEKKRSGLAKAMNSESEWRPGFGPNDGQS